jgi:hypothetical protein
MICTNCGKEVPKQAKVCGYCGQRLNIDTSAPVKTVEKPAAPEKHKPAAKKKLPVWVWIVMAVAFLAVLTVVIVLMGKPGIPIDKVPSSPQEVQAGIMVEPGDPDRTGSQYGVPNLDEFINSDGIAVIKEDQVVNIGGGYCPASASIMGKTFPYLEFHFTFDGIDVPRESFISADRQFDPRYCRLYYGIVRSWPPGDHEYRFRITTSTEINDGFKTYPPGMVWENIVKIKVTE